MPDFPKTIPLFPLPNLVMFPGLRVPLHIFEPRYRQMTEDALGSDRLITIVQIRPPAEWKSPKEPALEEYGCLGRIFKHERLADGRFNFLLLGRKRVRLTREIDSGKLYRMSEVEIIEDIPSDEPDHTGRADLIALFRKLFQGTLDPDLDALFESDLPVGVLADIMTQAIGFSSSVKQTFLSEPRVARRVLELLDLLREMKPVAGETDDESTSFPPPFSRN